jgi:hypothetical protein
MLLPGSTEHLPKRCAKSATSSPVDLSALPSLALMRASGIYPHTLTIYFVHGVIEEPSFGADTCHRSSTIIIECTPDLEEVMVDEAQLTDSLALKRN